MSQGQLKSLGVIGMVEVRKKLFAVEIAPKDGFAFISPGGDMIKSSWIFKEIAAERIKLKRRAKMALLLEPWDNLIYFPFDDSVRKSPLAKSKFNPKTHFILPN